MPAVESRTLQPLLIAASKYGAWAVVAIFLIWKLTGTFEGELKAQNSKLDDLAKRDAVQVLLLRAICERVSTTEAERAVCREAGR